MNWCVRFFGDCIQYVKNPRQSEIRRIHVPGESLSGYKSKATAGRYIYRIPINKVRNKLLPSEITLGGTSINPSPLAGNFGENETHAPWKWGS